MTPISWHKKRIRNTEYITSHLIKLIKFFDFSKFEKFAKILENTAENSPRKN